MGARASPLGYPAKEALAVPSFGSQAHYGLVKFIFIGAQLKGIEPEKRDHGHRGGPLVAIEKGLILGVKKARAAAFSGMAG